MAKAKPKKGAAKSKAAVSAKPQVLRIDAGTQALSEGRKADAQKEFEAAYKENHLSAALLKLGQLAQAEGQEVRAADLFRRYLESLTASIEENQRTELNAAIAKVRTPYIDASIVGEKGWLLRIDGQLIGELPLPGGVLIEPGVRRFGVEFQGRKVETSPLEIPADRQLTISLTLSGKQTLIAVVSLLPAVVMLMEPKLKAIDDGPEALVFSKAIQSAIQSARAALVRKERLAELEKKPEFASCLNSSSCQERLGKALNATYVLTLRSGQGSARDEVVVQLLDVYTGQLATERTIACAGCAPRALADKLGQLIREAIPTALSRARGTLEVNSTPGGARILLAKREVGRTPYQHELFTDKYEISVEQPGYKAATAVVEIKPGETMRLDLPLEKNLDVPPPKVAASEAKSPPPRRPLWRIIGGVSAIAVGVALVGVGASALAVDGQCKQPLSAGQTLDTCTPIYYTAAPGGGLVGAGGALVLGGALLVAWPPAKR